MFSRVMTVVLSCYGDRLLFVLVITWVASTFDVLKGKYFWFLMVVLLHPPAVFFTSLKIDILLLRLQSYICSQVCCEEHFTYLASKV